jgi:hypothetical protein
MVSFFSSSFGFSCSCFSSFGGVKGCEMDRAISSFGGDKGGDKGRGI